MKDKMLKAAFFIVLFLILFGQYKRISLEMEANKAIIEGCQQ
jgi:hypothetical protein